MIYVVLMVNDWILGLYSNEEKAEQAKQEFLRKRPQEPGGRRYNIRTYSYTVDAPPDC